MAEVLTQCGVSGKVFAPGDLYYEETIASNGKSEPYTRLVSVEAAGLTPEQIEAGVKDGSIKKFGEANAEQA